MIRTIYRLFERLGMRHFWGNYFDSRFYIGSLIAKKNSEMILDVGCGGGILLSLSPSPLKIGLDFSFDSLNDAKVLDSTMELIQGDAAHLPFRDNTFSNILAIHILVELKNAGRDWKQALRELKRVSAKNSQIIIAANNRQSKYFGNVPEENRLKYLTYKEQVNLFKDEFEVKIEGYDPYSKFIMYPFKKIIFNLPEKFSEKLGVERILFRLLRSKRYLKNGRSYVMICKKRPK